MDFDYKNTKVMDDDFKQPILIDSADLQLAQAENMPKKVMDQILDECFENYYGLPRNADEFSYCANIHDDFSVLHDFGLDIYRRKYTKKIPCKTDLYTIYKQTNIARLLRVCFSFLKWTTDDVTLTFFIQMNEEKDGSDDIDMLIHSLEQFEKRTRSGSFLCTAANPKFEDVCWDNYQQTQFSHADRYEITNSRYPILIRIIDLNELSKSIYSTNEFFNIELCPAHYSVGTGC